MNGFKHIRWVIEIVSIGAIGFIPAKDSWSIYWIIAPILAIVGAKYWENRDSVNDKQLRVKVQLQLLLKLISYGSSLDIRCTYHVPKKNKMLQAFNYLPDGGGSGRKFDAKKGIIGKAFTHKKPVVENFLNDEEYRQKMVSQYGYTAEELMERKADRKSYFCYPLIDEYHKVIGLIYLDSSRFNTFRLNNGDSNTEAIVKACENIKNSLI